MCTLATLHKDTACLKEFMGNRVPEILEATPIEKIFHVPSKYNIADLGTRCDATVNDVSPDSPWVKGFEYFSLPKDQWPTSQDITGASVPEEELVKPINVAAISMKQPLIDLERLKSRSYNLIINVVAIILKIARNKSFNITDRTAEDLEKAEQFCIKSSMRFTKQDYDKGKLTSLRPQVNEDGIIVLSSRADEGLEAYYGTDEFPILTYHDPLSHLWIKHVHEEDHSGVTRTVAKSRKKFWIIRARRLAEKIKYGCYRCKFLDIMMMKQQMAPIPRNRLVMSRPFYVTSLDLFGPLEIIDTVKRRVKKKVWGMIFSCASSRALHLDLTEDYGTDSILETLRRFAIIRRCPGEIISDQGSQLIAAAKDIEAYVSKWDWQPINHWAANQRIKWTVVPAEGQHQNGLSESLIKSVKRTLKHKIGSQILSFSQLQTIFYEVANIINDRPLGVISGSDPSCPKPLTPNGLLYPDSGGMVPQGPFDSEKKTTKRFRHIQQIITEWWECWYRTVLPTLVPSYKWLQKHRNVEVGDSMERRREPTIDSDAWPK